jgi:hypothetical protein
MALFHVYVPRVFTESSDRHTNVPPGPSHGVPIGYTAIMLALLASMGGVRLLFGDSIIMPWLMTFFSCACTVHLRCKSFISLYLNMSDACDTV